MKPAFPPLLSIRQRLPLLICGLLLSVILVFGWVSYVGIKKAELNSGKDRLKVITGQLGAMLSGQARNFITATYNIANKPAVRTYIRSNGRDSAAAVYRYLGELKSDTLNIQLELWNVSGKRLRVIPLQENKRLEIDIDPLFKEIKSARPDSGRAGKLYAYQQQVYFPVVTPVMDSGKTAGYAVRWRHVLSSPRAIEQLSRLMGSESKFYVGNADGSLWSDMISSVPPPLLGRDQEQVMGELQRVPNTKWQVAVQLSRREVLEAASGFLYFVIIAGVIILAVGMVVAWIMSRNISQPLIGLTDAASAIAAGNYASLVQMERQDELGKLASAFNAMTLQVQHSQRALEKEAVNYRLLFESNPMPMWILDAGTLEVLDVNDAAMRHYGYSKEEFLRLSARDLRPPEDVSQYMDHVKKRPAGFNSGVWRHRKKDGTIFMADIMADDITYKDRPARIVLAHDVTEKMRIEAELVQHKLTQQRLMAETAIQAQEKERESLGYELHDNVNQILASAKLYLEVARTRNEEMLSLAIEKSYESVNMAIGEIRQLSKQLAPPSLHTTLVHAISDLAEEVSGAARLPVTVTAQKFDEKLVNDDIKLTFYRIVQEQVNNILKHASASEIAITIETDRANVYLLITDNGIGFDTRKRSKGIGLRNIDSRIRFLDGNARVVSQTGKGCRLEISVPLKRQTRFAI